jgi:hypothetical protein
VYKEIHEEANATGASCDVVNAWRHAKLDFYKVARDELLAGSQICHSVFPKNNETECRAFQV